MRIRRPSAAVALLTACCLALGLSTSVGTAPAGAAAAAGCSGSLIVHEPITNGDNSVGGKPGKTTLAWLDVYYSAATGVNCAKTVHAASTYGKARYTYVDIIRCTQTTPGPRCTPAVTRTDGNVYKYYAGPVSVSAPHNCIQAFGLIEIQTWRGPIDYNTITRPGASHC